LKYDECICDFSFGSHGFNHHYFIYALLLFAMARNFLDYRGTWPMLMLNNVEPHGALGAENMTEFSRLTLTYYFEKAHGTITSLRLKNLNKNENAMYIKVRRIMSFSRHIGRILAFISAGEFIYIVFPNATISLFLHILNLLDSTMQLKLQIIIQKTPSYLLE
jgi:hypothetical protein